MPSFTLLTVLALSIYMGRAHGVLYGLGTGLLVDILVGYPLGFLMVLYTLSCFVTGTLTYLPEDLRRRLGFQLILRRAAGVFFVLLVGEIAILGYQYFLTASFDGRYLLNIVLRALAGALCSALIGPVVARAVLGKPKQGAADIRKREVKTF